MCQKQKNQRKMTVCHVILAQVSKIIYIFAALLRNKHQ